MPRNLTRIGPSSAESGEVEFWLSEPGPLPYEDGWGFSVFANENVFLAKFVYGGEEAARAAHKAIKPIFRDMVFLVTRAGEAEPLCPRCKGEGWVAEDDPKKSVKDAPGAMGMPCPYCNTEETWLDVDALERKEKTKARHSRPPKKSAARACRARVPKAMFLVKWDPNRSRFIALDDAGDLLGLSDKQALTMGIARSAAIKAARERIAQVTVMVEQDGKRKKQWVFDPPGAE